MEKLETGLPNQQALVSAPKNQEENYFTKLTIPCMVYAFFYTVFVFLNPAGVAVPFFAAGTLYFFYSFIKKYCGSVKKGHVFYAGSILLLAMITCTTQSWVLILLNRVWMIFLCALWILTMLLGKTDWNIPTYFNGIVKVLFGWGMECGSPFLDGQKYVSNIRESSNQFKTERKNNTKQILVGFAIGFLMLVFVLMLLGSSDIFFQEMLGKIGDALLIWEFLNVELAREIVGKICIAVFVFMVAYGSIIRFIQHKKWSVSIEKQTGKYAASIAITFSAMIAVVYLFYTFIQIFGLFMGKLTLPEGYSYAEYAREGFFQLLIICLFNIILVITCTLIYEKNKILNLILTCISLCTFVMVASSAFRMIMYIREYELTFLRVFVLWALLVIVFVMSGVMVSVYKTDFSLFRYIVAVITVLYIGFAASHPDYYIVTYNIAQIEKGEDVDLYYLENNLSLDATKPLLQYYEDSKQYEDRKYYLRDLEEYVKTEHFYEFNFSKMIARNELKQFKERTGVSLIFE